MKTFLKGDTVGIEVVIAAIVAYIAWQQHKTNRDKLRLDLYNKRYEVFSSLKILLAHILHQRSIELEQVNEFTRATKEAVFLFDEDIKTYLETIRKKALELWEIKETMKPLPKGDERGAKAREITMLHGWLRKQNKVAIDKFGKYLKFEQNLEGKTMNWKRGFKRIVLVLAVFIALGAAYCSVGTILEKHSYEKKTLTAKRFDYYDKYGYVGFNKTEDGTVSFVPDNPTKSQRNIHKTRLEKKYKELSDKSTLSTEELFEQIAAISTLLDLESGFLVNLSKGGLVGLCGVGGLVGGGIGFVIVWFIYKLLKWFVLGFCDNPKNEQKQ